MTKPTLKSLSAELEELRAHIALLEKKLGAAATAEAAPIAAAAPAAEPIQQAPPPPVEEVVSPEILLAISAAVAAFLGERAHVRHVRLVSSRSWSQQGRVSIQASHRLH